MLTLHGLNVRAAVLRYDIVVIHQLWWGAEQPQHDLDP